MNKELSEMTNEELWRLFPISLVDHSEKWDSFYDEVETLLQGLLSDSLNCRISHIGSTAISDIKAKNIVDVLVEIPSGANIGDVANLLEKNGFIRMSTAPDRISLNQGYTRYGFADKVYHIHLRFFGDNDELYFRDYLNEFPKVAKEYERLKVGLKQVLIDSHYSELVLHQECRQESEYYCRRQTHHRGKLRSGQRYPSILHCSRQSLSCY